MRKTTIQLTGLTNDEQRKMDSRLVHELFKLQEGDSLDTIITGLMTVNGQGSVLGPDLCQKYGPTLEVTYGAGEILTYRAPASVVYQLAKDPRIGYIEKAKRMQLS